MDMDIIRNEIQQGLSQVDSSFILTSFNVNEDKINRALTVEFTAQNANGEEIIGNKKYE